MRYSTDSRICELVKQLLAKGCTVEKGAPHNKLVFPSGRKYAIPGSPSDHRSALNFKSQLRRVAAEEGLS